MKRAFVVALFGLLLGACAGQPKRDESAPLDERLARLGYVRGQAVDRVFSGSISMDGSTWTSSTSCSAKVWEGLT